MLKGVPAFGVDRKRRPPRILRERLTATGIGACTDYESWAGARGVCIVVETRIEDEVAAVTTRRRADRGSPIKPPVVCGRRTAVGRRDVQVDVSCCSVTTSRKRFAVTAPTRERTASIFGVENAGLRRDQVRTRWHADGAEPSGCIGFKTLKVGCVHQTTHPED